MLALAMLLPAAVQGSDEPAPLITSFRLQASNGYELVALAGVSPDGEDGWIGLFLTSADAAVTYAAPATVTDGTIEADLGRLGRISLALVPTGKTKSVPWGCKPGGKKRIETERYEGTVEFHGEEGFTDVSATSAPIDYRLLSRIKCYSGEVVSGSPRRHLPGVRLDVEKRRLEKYRVEFDAVQKRPGARTLVSAEVEEHRGEIEIHRGTSIRAVSGALRYDRRLLGATLAPPAPFAGHASFHGNARRANQWTGNLSVDLPGHSDVPLTGPGFAAALEHLRH